MARDDTVPGGATPYSHCDSHPGCSLVGRCSSVNRMQIPVVVAPLWYRTLANLIDFIPLITIYTMVLVATGLASPNLPESRWSAFDAFVDLLIARPFFLLPPILIWLGLVFVYTLTLELTLGQTIGKRLLNLVMVDRYGRRPEAIMVLIRNLLRIVTLLTLGLGYIWAAFDTERRTFHDWVSGIWVVSRTDGVPVR